MKKNLHSHVPQSEKLLLGEMQLLLAEKRTFFSLLRTGIAIFSFPLTVVAFLGATAEYHSLFLSVPITLAIIAPLIIISIFGLLLFWKAQRRIKKLNELVMQIKKNNHRIEEIVI